MIRQIFNLYSNILYKVTRLMQFNVKLNLFFILIWIALYYFEYITERRLLIFLSFILTICVYKIICKNLDNNKLAFQNILYVLLWIDYIKLFIINILIYFYILIYDFKLKYKNHKMTGISIFILNNLFINPTKMLLNKFYNILYVWKTTPILEIFFKRIHGSVLSILIFSNIISYVWYLMNYSIFNIYVMLLIINLIDELVKSQKFIEYKIFSYLEYIKYLNLNKNLFKIIELRRSSSILSLYIQKLLQKVNFNLEQNNKIKSFALVINNIYSRSFSVINLKIQIKEYKLYGQQYLFKPFYIEIVTLLNDYFYLLSKIEYIKIKNASSLLNLDELHHFILLVIKLLLYYLWDFEYINKSDVSTLFISDVTSLNELRYKWVLGDDLIKKLFFIKTNNIEFFDIQKNVLFYDQLYLYANFLRSYHKLRVIDFANYLHMERYIDVFLDEMLIISDDIDYSRANEIDSSIELNILEKLNAYKQLFVEEWRNSKTMDVEKANLQRLNTLNDYINNHFSEIQNIKKKK